MAQPNFAERLGELKQRGLTTLVVEGASEAEIAKHLGMHRSTLRPYVKAVKHDIAAQQEAAACPTPAQGSPEGHPGPPLAQMDDGIPEISHGPPPLYIHPGIPDDSTDEPGLGAEAIAGLPQRIPALPLVGIREEPHEPAPTLQGMALPMRLLEDLQQTWPELQELLSWWRARHRQAQEPPQKLARVTYHVQPKWIEAVKQEADRTGESYAAVVDRAFLQYFEAR